MTEIDAAPPAAPIGSRGERRDDATAIYGSLLVTGMVAVQWRADSVPDAIALTVVVSVVVFWLAHVWSEIVSRRVRGRITPAEGVAIARAETPMLSAAVAPALVLAFGPLVATHDQAIAVALFVCIAELFVWGLIVGRAAHSSPLLTLRVAIVDSLLGLVIVALKVLVIH
ncbi:MAG TPA: hypothetical protein VID95_10440 [Candidatus Limnocylindrales bacterium]|jgi:hypothetical protein